MRQGTPDPSPGGSECHWSSKGDSGGYAGEHEEKEMNGEVGNPTPARLYYPTKTAYPGGLGLRTQVAGMIPESRGAQVFVSSSGVSRKIPGLLQGRSNAPRGEGTHHHT